MKTAIVADGAERLLGTKEVQARLRAMREAVRARHAAELATAGFFRRLLLHWRITLECWREQRKVLPSPHTLYGKSGNDSHA